MKVLLADDDPGIADLLSRNLRECGWSVDVVEDGRDALHYLLDNACDVAIIDRQMPGLDGVSVVEAARAARVGVPILLLTVMSDIRDRVVGLKCGADDYLVKPFHFLELEARIQILLKRGQLNEVKQSTQLKVFDLSLNLLTRKAERGGVKVELKAKEFSLLEVLMRNPGHVITKTMLLEQVWDFAFAPSSTVVETHISRLRAKVDRPFDVALIHTIRDAGYSIHGPE
ncbi:response regulator transcription factor [Loktanella sp. Alg231-35]|uniref:response regulator transcription factor n=1 Tax=Loktanella sp. Alg231-35 TaxID=1922220 RepID=UPI000D553B6F|nr:response regulator transcription factor [Loktanella sp. Alg231-35]